MWWVALNWQETEYYVEVKQDGINQPKKFIPCWSLTALLIILSEAAFDYDDDGGVSLFSFEKKWRSHMYDCPVECSNEYDEPIDSVFEIVCRALKDGIIKNKKI